jgi:hypothetical protein
MESPSENLWVSISDVERSFADIHTLRAINDEFYISKESMQ